MVFLMTDSKISCSNGFCNQDLFFEPEDSTRRRTKREPFFFW